MTNKTKFAPDRIVVEPVNYGGWSHNIRLCNGEVEAIITLDVGPRIIRFGRMGGPNVLKEIPEELGRSGEDKWTMRGGHRLWTSPEDPERTYAPDNGPVRHVIEGKIVHATAEADGKFGLERTMSVSFTDDGTGLRVKQTVKNLGSAAIEIAVWSLTVMAAGGRAIIPLPPFRAHPGDQAAAPEDFAPAWELSLWPYFRFTDPRFSFGAKFIQIRQSELAPTKIGLAHTQGWAAYLLGDDLFVKSVSWQADARYPDGGCNFECYSDQGVLELETLGPLAQVAPGEAVTHEEVWSLCSGVKNVAGAAQDGGALSEDDIEQQLLPRVHASLP